MAVTQNTYTGNGSTVLYSFTFPYLETTDIKVSVNGTNTTAYTLANATTVQFNTAPANGAAIRIYRETDDSNLQATFYPGSAIRSSDLNDNFTQNLYVTQEANNVSAAATTTANTALTNSNTAISTANASAATSAQALANSQTAVTQSASAVSTANSASSSASSAVSTANSAASNAATALSNSQTALTQSANAVTTANQSSTTAGTALTNSQTALSQSASAVSTAGTASTNATNALSNSQTALTQSASATSTANTALSTANAAASAVANAILYDTVANVAAIPASPANNDAVEVVNSTGIQTFTPLSGLPPGFVGDAGLSVRLVYTTTGSTWNWIQYFPNDPEARYGDAITTLQTDLTAAEGDITTLQGDVTTLQGDVLGLDNDKVNKAGDTMTGNLTAAALIPSGSTVPTNGVYLPAANSVAISTNGTGRLFVNDTGRIDCVRYGIPSVIQSQRSDGTSASPSAISSSVELGRYSFLGYDGATHKNIGWLTGFSDGAITNSSSPGFVAIATTPSGSVTPQERLRITSTGLVGIGTSSPSALLHLNATSAALLIARSSAAGTPSATGLQLSIDGITYGKIYADPSGGITFAGPSNDHATIDLSGRLLVGTSTARSNFFNATLTSNFQIEGVGHNDSSFSLIRNQVLSGTQFGPNLVLGSSGGTTNGSNTLSLINGFLGNISFQGTDGTKFVEAATIRGEVDGTPGANDMPGRLVFSTTSDNSTLPSERLRIASTGAIGLSGANYGTSGQVLTSNGSASAPSWQTPAASVDAFGSVGSYGLIYDQQPVVRTPGATYSGSGLYWADAAGQYPTSPQPSGTWRTHGYKSGAGYPDTQTTLWIRIA